jgi:hypothetical protein
MNRVLSESETALCETLLEDAALIIDSYNENADVSIKQLITCRMIIRVLGDGEDSGFPTGASQGSMSGLGYSQSWTIGSGGSTGELYISKLERNMLKVGNHIGSYSPVQELVGGDWL